MYVEKPSLTTYCRSVGRRETEIMSLSKKDVQSILINFLEENSGIQLNRIRERVKRVLREKVKNREKNITLLRGKPKYQMQMLY